MWLDLAKFAFFGPKKCKFFHKLHSRARQFSVAATKALAAPIGAHPHFGLSIGWLLRKSDFLHTLRAQRVAFFGGGWLVGGRFSCSRWSTNIGRKNRAAAKFWQKMATRRSTLMRTFDKKKSSRRGCPARFCFFAVGVGCTQNRCGFFRALCGWTRRRAGCERRNCAPKHPPRRRHFCKPHCPTALKKV